MSLFDDGDRTSRKGVTLAQNSGAGVIPAKGIVVKDVAKADDVSVKTPNVAGENSLFYGVALESIPVGEFKRVQNYGYVTGVSIRQEAGQAVSVGDIMKLNGATAEFIRSSAANGTVAHIVSLSAIGVGTALVTGNVFIRSL